MDKECGGFMEKIKIDTEYITLGQFLKMTNIISSGGEAKWFLAENTVLVDDVLEARRGRKLYKGMSIKACGKEYEII